MSKKILAFSALALFLYGCSSHPTLPLENRSKLDIVFISETTAVPQSPYFFGKSDLVAAGLGAGLGAVINQQTKTEPDEIKDYLAREKIDIGEIVRSEFMSQLSNHPYFSSKIDSKSNTKFFIDITNYGLKVGNAGIFAKLYVPVLSLKARLIDSNGIVLWEDNEDSLGGEKGGYRAEYENYFKSPNNFRDAFKKSAEILINKFMKNI